MKCMRRHFRGIANDYFLVYDRSSDQLLGRILNMSQEGALIITEKPMPVPEIIPCRMEFPEDFKRVQELSFDAECRWCRFNDKSGLYETGIKISFNNEEDKKLIQDMIYSWMVVRSESLNSRQKAKVAD